MVLILEILLTIAAWRKGWKARALIPGGLMLFVGFLIGLALGESGGTLASVSGLVLILEILGIIALIVMATVPPKSATEADVPMAEEPGLLPRQPVESEL